MRDDDLVPVGSFTGRIETEIARGALEAAGIQAVVSADDAGGQYASVWAEGVRLLVHSSDLEAAREVLRVEA